MFERFLAAITCKNEDVAEATAQDFSLLPEAKQLEAIAQLREFIKHTDSEERWWAVRALSAIPSELVPPILTEMLNDPSAEVRQSAAMGLRNQPSPNSIPGLLKALDDTDQLTAQLAVQALIVTGDAAVEPLIAFIDKCSQQSLGLAVRALAQIGDERAARTFYDLLDSDSMLVQYWANEGLERLGVGLILFKP